MLDDAFFNRDADTVAKDLLGKIIRHRHKSTWLSCQIIETESYYINEKGSHSSLGFTQKRKALFMPPGTIYMYYARGADSLNVSAKGAGNAVLIKSAIPFTDALSPPATLQTMQRLNPVAKSGKVRNIEKLCSGQTLLCRSLHLRVKDWNQMKFDINTFYFEDVNQIVPKYIQTTRLGIPSGRDEHLLQRYIDYNQRRLCTRNPVTSRNQREGEDYFIRN